MLINVETKKSCLHSKLPVAMKETFVFDFKDTLLVCSSQTESDQENLQCFKWDVSIRKWTVFETPLDNGVYGFISAVRIPGKQVGSTNIHRDIRAKNFPFLYKHCEPIWQI